MSIATTSTLGVSTLSTVTSPNWSAEEMRSPRSSSRLPSSVMSSIISYSSSSVTEIWLSPFVSFAADCPIHVSSLDSGAKIFISTHRTPAQLNASFSLNFLATLLGSISPTKNTTIVVIIVLTETALSPHIRLTATVTTEAVVICTMFVQISRVLIARSKFSITYSARFAWSLPLSAAARIRDLDAEANAVSATASHAAQKSKIAICNHGNLLPSSILG